VIRPFTVNYRLHALLRMIPNFRLTYKYPTSTRIMLLMAACFFSAIAVFVKSSDKIVASLCFGPLTLLCLVEFVLTSYKITITNDEINTHRFGRDTCLRWDEIGSIRSRDMWGGLQLQDSNNSFSLRIDSQVEGYLEIVKLIGYKRPDLWNTNIPEKFRQTIWGIFIFGTIGVFMIGIGIKGTLQGELVTGIGLLALGLLTWGMVLMQIRTVSFQEDDLVLKSILRKRYLKARDIHSIQMDTAKGQYDTVAHRVMIELMNGKTIALSGFREGPAMLYQALQTWWQQNTSL